MGAVLRGIIAGVALAAASTAAAANSLTVSPITVDVQAPKAVTSVTLESSGSEQLNAQIRIFKWTVVGGKDQLVPTKDVVASPPALKVKPNGKAIIRVVRLDKSPVADEESYRLIISEVPKAPKLNKGVGVAFRYSIPAFFTPAEAAPDVTWKADTNGSNLVITATNTGNRRVRLNDLAIAKGGKTISISTGLSGYLLANSTRVWTVKGGAKGAKSGSTVQIIAEGDLGKINATAVVGAAN